MPKEKMQSVTKNGMTIRWEFQETNQLHFKLSAPCRGWVAIGLNTKNELVGSNLIMASITPNDKIISDRSIIDFGNHQSMEDLGIQSAVSILSGHEQDQLTEVDFIINTISDDPYHFNLEKGKTYYLTMAYSREDDFMHHSAMRTSVKIVL